MMIKKYASLLSADAANYAEIIKKIEKEDYEGLHFDVMDGHFVKNFAFSPQIIKSLRKLTTLTFDVHLEISNPGEFLDIFIDAGSDMITIHPNSTTSPERDLRYLKAKNISASIAVDPEIEIEEVKKYLPLVDNVIIMCVYPGFGEQDFIYRSLEKIEGLKTIIDHQKLNISISVDGSINKETAKLVIDKGAGILIFGSSIFRNY